MNEANNMVLQNFVLLEKITLLPLNPKNHNPNNFSVPETRYELPSVARVCLSGTGVRECYK